MNYLPTRATGLVARATGTRATGTRAMGLLLCVVAATTLVPTPRAMAQADAPVRRRRAVSADQLPVHTYKIAKKPSEMLTDDAACLKLAAQLERDTRNDLTNFAIENRRDHNGYYWYLMIALMVQRKYNDALPAMQKARVLEDDPTKRMLFGLMERAVIAASQAPKGSEDEAFEQSLKATIDKLPYGVVGPELQKRQSLTEQFPGDQLIQMTQDMIDPKVQDGVLPFHQAAALLNYYFLRRDVLTHRAVIIKTIAAYVERNTKRRGQ